MSAFSAEPIRFYLQRYFVQDWVDNTMVFLEVDNIDCQRSAILDAGIPGKYPGVRVCEIQEHNWGREFFLHDPSGYLWHIGSFCG